MKIKVTFGSYGLTVKMGSVSLIIGIDLGIRVLVEV